MKQFADAERDLAKRRKIVDQQHEGIAELYDLQDSLEQYMRQKSLDAERDLATRRKIVD